MKKPKIYVAGPMSGFAYWNYNLFDEAAAQLVNAGWEVITPVQLDRAAGLAPEDMPADTDWASPTACGHDIREALRRDIDALMSVDAIFLLLGWPRSGGTLAELAVAKRAGLAVFKQRADLELDPELFIDPKPETCTADGWTVQLTGTGCVIRDEDGDVVCSVKDAENMAAHLVFALQDRRRMIKEYRHRAFQPFPFGGEPQKPE